MAPPVTPTPDDVIEIEDDDVVEMSDFPNTNPYQNADRVLSVIAGNSRFHWAMHDGEKADFFPFLFWKTVAFQKDRPPTPDDLPRFLPRKAYEYMGGPGFADNPSHQTMIDHLSKKKMPCIHIYMVITNPDARETIPKLFRHLPCRFIELQASDFVKGAYRGVGVDRCATLRAAMALYGAPAMVIDGGTAMTWTCADAEKNLIGGGITVGVGAKFNSLHAFTRGGLAQLSPSVVMGRMKKCQEEKKPLATIANNTQDAMIGGVLREVAVNLTTIIRQFVKSTNQHFAEHPPPPPPPTDEETGSDIAPPLYNTNCHVCVTGGDAAIFEDLLSPDHAHVLEEWEECGEDGKPPPLGASINHHKNLAGHAVANVLKEQYIAKEDMTDPIQLIRCDVMGARVCKGEKRGTVYDFMKKAAELKDDLYKIKYDDGKEDFCNTVDLYECLLQFAEKGEDDKFTELDSEARAYHKENSKEVAERYATLIDDFQAILDKKRAADAEAEERANKRAKPTSPDELRRIALGPKKKPSDNLKLTDKNIANNPNAWKGRRVAKYFESLIYYGTVGDYDGEYWHITYDDGDKEDYDAKELLNQLKEYELNKHTDKKAK